VVGKIALGDGDVYDAEEGEIFLLVELGCVEDLHVDHTRLVDHPNANQPSWTGPGRSQHQAASALGPGEDAQIKRFIPVRA
jgi:hypothetical protein